MNLEVAVSLHSNASPFHHTLRTAMLEYRRNTHYFKGSLCCPDYKKMWWSAKSKQTNIEIYNCAKISAINQSLEIILYSLRLQTITNTTFILVSLKHILQNLHYKITCKHSYLGWLHKLIAD